MRSSQVEQLSIKPYLHITLYQKIVNSVLGEGKVFVIFVNQEFSLLFKHM